MNEKEWIKATLPYLIKQYGELGSMFMEMNVDGYTMSNHPGADNRMFEFISLGHLIEKGKELYMEPND